MHYCYVVIDNEPDSTAANIVACGDPSVDQEAWNDDDDTLTLLLQAGWRPVRETTMGARKDSVSALVVLEKDSG